MAREHADDLRRANPGIVEGVRRFKANTDVSLALEAGARHALIGPNGAGKTTLINLLTGVLLPPRARCSLARSASPLPQHERVKRGMTRTFQINTLFPGLTVLESVVLAICEREGRGAWWHRTVAQCRDEVDEGACAPAVAASRPRRRTPSRAISPMASSAWSRSRWRWHAAQDFVARRARGRHSGS